MKAVPTFTISKSAAFIEKAESWGHLIASEADLARIVVNWIARRYREAGRVASVQRVSPAGADDTEDMGLNCNIEVVEDVPATATTAASQNTATLEGSFWAFVSAKNPVYADLEILRPCFRDITGPRAEAVDGVYRLGYFRVDMSYLFQRFFSQHDIFARFDVFSERVRGTGDEYLANPPGDVECLTKFFDEFASFRSTQKLASANLVFDTFSRRSGLLPKSVRNTFVWFHERLKKCDGILFPEDQHALHAVKYGNLSYSANYALLMTSNFEKLGTFHFHCEQLFMFLISDGVAFRSIGDDDEMRSMVPNLIVYGPPGIGKSTAALLLMSVYKHTLKPFSYASHRADYGQKPSADYDNNICMYQDEAPAWLVDISKLANGDSEKITQKKEQKSSGKMVGERMCQNPATGVWATMSFNGEVFNNPEILNTNSPEKCGDGPLLNRYNQRYFMAGSRARHHALMTGADGPSTDELRAIKHEMQTERSLLLLLSKLQSVGIVPDPDLTVHFDYYRRFLRELRANPYLDAEPFTSGDRRSGMIQILFNCLVNRIAIRRAFIEPGAEFRGKPFDIQQMLSLSKFMLHGDMQASIIAISAFSHVFRSPTEWRVGVLIAEKYFVGGRLITAIVNGAKHVSFPVHFDDNLVPVPEFVDTFDDFINSDEKKAVLKDKYALVTKEKYSFRNSPTDADMAKTFAHTLRDGSTEFMMMPEHITKRVMLLTTTMIRAGPDKGLPCLSFFYHEGLKQVAVFVLKSWLLETAFNHEWSVKSMLHRAALSNRFTQPGRYVVPAPLLLQDAAAEISARGSEDLRAKFGTIATSYVPHMMSYFDVCLHERDCPAFNADHEQQSALCNWNFNTCWPTAAGTRAACTCFRSNTRIEAGTFANDNLYDHDSETVAKALFVSKHGDRNVHDTRANALDKKHFKAHRSELMAYPVQGVEESQRAQGGENRLYSSLDAPNLADLERRTQWAAACRLAGDWCSQAANLDHATALMQGLSADDE
jgi:DNA polymerase III delta prime subunit